jgi:hypothetical protein
VLVGGIDAEIEDVFLRNPDVLDELPRRVLEAGGAGAALVGRDPIDGFVEANMSVLPIEDSSKVIAKVTGWFGHSGTPQ